MKSPSFLIFYDKIIPYSHENYNHFIAFWSNIIYNKNSFIGVVRI